MNTQITNTDVKRYLTANESNLRITGLDTLFSEQANSVLDFLITAAQENSINDLQQVTKLANETIDLQPIEDRVKVAIARFIVQHSPNIDNRSQFTIHDNTE